jgi:hypothetical protein
MNKAQELHFELMKLSSFNSFDGGQVVADLSRDEDLWRGAILLGAELLTLRDIEDGFWHGDTLYMLPAAGREDELEALARCWNADEVDWIGGRKAEQLLGHWAQDDNPRRILRLWWD